MCRGTTFPHIRAAFLLTPTLGVALIALALHAESAAAQSTGSMPDERGTVTATRTAATNDVPTPNRTRRLRRRLGFTLSAGGAALLATTAGMRFRGSPADGSVDGRNAPPPWLTARSTMLTAGILGSGATSAGFGLLLRDLERPRAVPSWTWVLGGIGLGATALGLAELARADVCPGNVDVTGPCARAIEQRDRGTLWLLAGVPLASLPLGAWLGHRRAPSVSVSTTTTQASIHVEGVF